jgi:ABC-type transport system involved in multi-copper enzyme maturation permease subunit
VNARPSLARLTAVELRKSADTRAGRWLLGITGLIAVGVVVVLLCVGDRDDLTFSGLYQPALLPLAILLPVLGVLAVTSEWSQRTALTTFALVPVRSRLVAAKLAASVVLSILAAAAGFAVAAAGNLIGQFAGGDGGWHVTGAELDYAVLFLVVNMLVGVGFGLLLMNSAAAIVLLFLLPTLWSLLGSLVHGLHGAAQWLDLNSTTEPLLSNQMTAPAWARLAVSVVVWVLLPLAAGLLRQSRREVV